MRYITSCGLLITVCFAEEQLDLFASDEDFLKNVEQAFGDNWQPQQAEDLIQGLANGNAMPKAEVIHSSNLKANGAFVKILFTYQKSS